MAGLTKVALRRQAKERRKQLSEIERTLWNQQITQNVLQLSAVQQATQVLCYLSTSDEVDTWKLIEQLWAQGKEVFVPRCLDDQGQMEFYQITSFEQVDVGFWGIAEPKQDCPLWQEKQGAVCLLPGLAFTQNGDRLGYGKGYYDYFLSKSRAITIGICYNQCIVLELPQQPHDQAMDMVVTESAIYAK